MNIKTFTIHSVRNVFAFFIALGLGYVAYTVNPTTVAPTKVEAVASSLAGYAWSDTIGYISFSGTATDAANSPYSVQLDPPTGDFSGIAWSSGIDTSMNPNQGGIGWISFDRAVTGNPPGAPYQSTGGAIAKTDALGNVTGWARALSACTNNYWDTVNKKCTNVGAGDASGGWDGWIKLSKDPADSGSTYGVKINPANGKFSGYAWGGAQVDASGNSISGGVSVIGWIKFAASGNVPAGSDDAACSGVTNDYSGTDKCKYGIKGPILTPTCTSNLDCPGGQLCNIAIGGVCVTPGGTCGSGSSCGIGQSCNGSNLCVSTDGPCSSDTQCVSGQVCNLATSTCVAPVGGSCTNSTDCLNGQICNTTAHSCYDKPKTQFWQF